MIDSPVITRTSAQPAAVVHLRIPRERIQNELPRAVQELQVALAEQAQVPQGPLFAHHLTLSDDEFDFEVGFPVATPIVSTGRVKSGELPAATVARTTYYGPYEGLHAAWGEFGKRLEREGILKGEGFEAGDTLWECYVTGPESETDPAAWQTELNLPLVRPAG